MTGCNSPLPLSGFSPLLRCLGLVLCSLEEQPGWCEGLTLTRTLTLTTARATTRHGRGVGSTSIAPTNEHVAPEHEEPVPAPGCSGQHPGLVAEGLGMGQGLSAAPRWARLPAPCKGGTGVSARRGAPLPFPARRQEAPPTGRCQLAAFPCPRRGAQRLHASAAVPWPRAPGDLSRGFDGQGRGWARGPPAPAHTAALLLCSPSCPRTSAVPPFSCLLPPSSGDGAGTGCLRGGGWHPQPVLG